jgi:hypothetical protein
VVVTETMMQPKPAAVRVLRGAGVVAVIAGAIALGIGALLGFDELAKIWAVVGGLLLAAGACAFAGARPTRGGLLFAMIACLLMLILPPVGTLVTIVIVIVASQSWPQLRDYYGIRRTA